MGRFLLHLLIFCTVSTLACSSSLKQNPLSPHDTADNIPISHSENVTHTLFGSWTVEFNINDLSMNVTPDRESCQHYNITSLIPAPLIQINSWDPATETIDVDVAIQNPYMIDVYDVRLIIYTDTAGHLLLNDDNWTALFDIQGGFPANPFKAYAKQTLTRRFGRLEWQSENLKIKCPQNDYSVKFAIEVSFPSNCPEPYQISGFTHDILLDTPQATASAQVTVNDWQNNVNSVSLFCQPVAGPSPVIFEYSGNDIWNASIRNVNGVPEGEYPGYIQAGSSDASGLYLYDDISLEVSHFEQSSWVIALNCSNGQDGYSLLFDDFDNVYVTGEFSGTVDFDPGPGITLGYGNWDSTAFLAKYDVSGNFLWVNTWADLAVATGLEIASDSSENIYVASRLTESGSLMKYTSSGDFIRNAEWANTYCKSVAIDNAGDVYVTGYFKGEVDFDPGPGVEIRNAPNNTIYLCKLTSDFEFIWVDIFLQDGDDSLGSSIAIDSLSQIYLSGYFSGVVDFDPGSGIYELVSVGGRDAFAAKYRPDGSLVWASSWGSDRTDSCSGIHLSNTNDIYTVGYYGGLIDLNPGSDQDLHELTGFRDVFLSKLDLDGNYQWGKTWGSNNEDIGYAIELTDSQSILVTGTFVGTVDFDPGPGIFNLSTGGSEDAYISKFDAEGNFNWARSWGDGSDVPSYDIKINSDGFIHTTGSYGGRCDFDPGPGEQIRESYGGRSLYILKLNPDGLWL